MAQSLLAEAGIIFAGTDDPAFLFVHGFCCGKEDWEQVIERLKGQFRCVAIDLPGHGAAHDFAAPTIDICAKAINEAKARIGSSQVIVVGHSMAVKMVREAYRQSPDGYVGMVLVDGSLYVSDRQTMLGNAERALANGTEALVSRLFAQMYTPDRDPTLPPRHLARALALNPQAVRHLFLDSVDWDTNLALESIAGLQLPVLVLQATTFDSNFKWKPLADGGSTPLIDALKAHVKDVEAVVTEGAGHFLMIERPDDAASAMAAFGHRVRAAIHGKERACQPG